MIAEAAPGAKAHQFTASGPVMLLDLAKCAIRLRPDRLAALAQFFLTEYDAPCAASPVRQDANPHHKDPEDARIDESEKNFR